MFLKFAGHITKNHKLLAEKFYKNLISDKSQGTGLLTGNVGCALAALYVLGKPGINIARELLKKDIENLQDIDDATLLRNHENNKLLPYFGTESAGLLLAIIIIDNNKYCNLSVEKIMKGITALFSVDPGLFEGLGEIVAVNHILSKLFSLQVGDNFWLEIQKTNFMSMFVRNNKGKIGVINPRNNILDFSLHYGLAGALLALGVISDRYKWRVQGGI